MWTTGRRGPPATNYSMIRTGWEVTGSVREGKQIPRFARDDKSEYSPDLSTQVPGSDPKVSPKDGRTLRQAQGRLWAPKAPSLTIEVMSLHLFNTLSGKLEEFQPLEDNLVRMYACGPTVYDYGHIGNFRTFVAVDVLRRFLKQSGYKVKHVMNITDVEDKIIRNAARDGVTVQRVHPEVHRCLPGRLRGAEHRAAGDDREGHRTHSGDGALHRRVARQGIMPTPPRMGRITSASPSSRSTASCRRRTSPG